MSWILLLEPFTECAYSVRTRTNTTLDQNFVLKANVDVFTACTVMLLLTTCMNFNTPPLALIAPFDARFASQTRKYQSTKKDFCQLNEFKLQGVEKTTTTRVPPQPGSEKKRLLLAHH